MSYREQAEQLLAYLFPELDASAERLYLGTKFAESPAALQRVDRAHESVYSMTSTLVLDAEDRRDNSLSRCFLFVLDDIGRDYPVPALEPTAIVETSEGNYQYLYCYAEPVSIGEGRAVVDALKAVGGLGDPGALTVGRLFKLPGSVRGKDGDQFRARLVNCDGPDYTVDELVAAFGLELGAIREPDRTRVELSAEVLAEHPVLGHVSVIDYEDGKAHIVCPNCAAHSVDTGYKQTSLLFDDAGGYAFHCFHASCQTFDFDSWLAGQALAELGTALVPVVDAEAAEVTDMAALTGVPAVAGGSRGAYEALRESLVIMASGKYYSAECNALIANDKTLDKFYGHRLPRETADGDPLPPLYARLGADPDALRAVDLGWMPVRDADFSLVFAYEGMQLVNTYQPPAMVPRAGDVSKWLELVRFICGDDAELVLDHMAFTLQRPAEKIRWQVLIVGTPRTGKSMLFEPLVQMLGSSARYITNEVVKSGWGDIYVGKKALVFEEMYGIDRRQFNDMKTKFANSDIETLNLKGRPTTMQPNLYSMYMLTNHDNAFQMEENEDKLFALRAPSEPLPARFYTELGALYASPGFFEACMHYLLSRDVSDFSYGRLPRRTETLIEMCAAGRADYAHYLEDQIENEEYPFHSGVSSWKSIRTALRQEGYACGDKGVHDTLEKLGWIRVRGERLVGGVRKQVRFWARADLAENLTIGERYDLFSERSSPAGVVPFRKPEN